VLAHGAGAGERHPWMRRVAAGLAERGVSVATFDFPYMQAGRRTPDKGRALEDAYRAAWNELASAGASGRTPPAAMFAGGKSMGGRIASQVAAGGGFSPAPAGLIFFGYPLHPPGKPADRRDRHLPAIGAPLLFLHGTRDPFGSPDEMRALVGSLPRATLHLVEGGDHSLQRAKRDDASGASIGATLDIAAAWVTAQSPR
jgi:predicted alpha/beta-hydrolase family hydrolase